MKKKTIIKIAKYTVILLIFFFIVKYFYENLNTVQFCELHFNYFYLLISVFIYLLHIFVNVLVWYIITKQNNCSIGLFESIKVRVYSDFGKYIPGKIFAYGILFYSYDQKSISKKKIAVCSFQELIIGTIATIIIALVSIYLSDFDMLRRYNVYFLAMAIMCIVMIHPGILSFVANKLLKLFKREPISIITDYGQIFLVLILFITSWLIFGLGFYFFINSFYEFSFSYYFFTTGAFAIAGLIGMIAVFAPSGLGVREGVLVFLLKYIFPNAIAALISLISRLWMIICELLFLFFIIIMNSLFKKIFSRQAPK